jgi:hypothetical protein
VPHRQDRGRAQRLLQVFQRPRLDCDEIIFDEVDCVMSKAQQARCLRRIESFGPAFGSTEANREAGRGGVEPRKRRGQHRGIQAAR